MNKASINGVNIYAPSSRANLISYAMDNNKILVAVNAEKVYNATSITKDIINRNLGYPDGFGAIAALKSKGIDSVVKIPGCELWLDIVEEYCSTHSFYFIGAKLETIEKTVDSIKEMYPSIVIKGYRDGYFDSNEEEAIVSDIIYTKPQIVFVALGSPRQELFMEKLSQKHKALYQGLGGSFDVFVGNVKRAPKTWVDLNLEWLYRLIQEPKRITRQIKLSLFFLKLKLGFYK